MTDQEILIKILEDVVTTSKRRLLKTLDGELLKQPTEKLMEALDQNYSEYCDYLQKVKYALQVVLGISADVELGGFKIDLDKGVKHD